MKRFEFEVNFGRVKYGTLSFEAKNSEEATEEALSYIGRKLADAFPELDIEYSVEEV